MKYTVQDAYFELMNANLSFEASIVLCLDEDKKVHLAYGCRKDEDIAVMDMSFMAAYLVSFLEDLAKQRNGIDKEAFREFILSVADDFAKKKAEKTNETIIRRFERE